MYLIIDFQVGLDINNCITFYTNFADNLLARLRHDYNGICFNGCLILYVIEVIKAGECVFSHPTLPTLGSLSVVFRACVVQYSAGDMISGCVVRSMKPHDELAMISEHANALIIPTAEGQDTDVLTTDSVVTINVIGAFANPGSPKIALNAHLYEPQPTTHYYPIIPGTHAQMFAEGEALTRKKYARIGDVMLARKEMTVIQGITIQEAAIAMIEYFAHVMREIGAARAPVPDIIRRLFYPFKAQRTIGKDIAAFVNVQDVVRASTIIPPNATCLVSCAEFHPFDGHIGISTTPLEDIPGDWIREIAQPAGIVLTRCLERFIDYLGAGIALSQELVNPTKLMATKNLIVVQTNKKK